MNTTDQGAVASTAELGPLPEAALTVVHNPHTMERQVSTHGVAYYGSNWCAERECYTAEQMRAYAMQERAAERERCAAAVREISEGYRSTKWGKAAECIGDACIAAIRGPNARVQACAEAEGRSASPGTKC